MAGFDPAADWDRHVAAQEAPYPVGKQQKVRSREPHVCESCYGSIPAGAVHIMQAQISGADGLFTKPLRLHLEGKCLPPPEDVWSAEYVG